MQSWSGISPEKAFGTSMDKKTAKFLTAFTGCLSIVVILALISIGIYASFFSGPDAFEISEYHPFRSRQAQERYLAIYDQREKSWPVPYESEKIDTSYGPTYVHISGQPNAPPLVLLHGAAGNSLQWIPNVAALSQDYRVYAIDNIYDHGRSIYMREMDNTYDFVTWMDEVFNQLDLGNDINLVGLSYGGWLSSQYALRYPERLENVVLIAPAATVLPISSEWLRRAAITALPHPYFTEGFIAWMLADFVNQDEANRDLVKEWAYEAYVAARSFKPKSLANPNVLSNSDLMSLGVRMLFLVGENEKLYSPQEAIERLNSVAPQVETAIIPNAGHDLTMARAALVNRKILEFLGKP